MFYQKVFCTLKEGFVHKKTGLQKASIEKYFHCTKTLLFLWNPCEIPICTLQECPNSDALCHSKLLSVFKILVEAFVNRLKLVIRQIKVENSCLCHFCFCFWHPKRTVTYGMSSFMRPIWLKSNLCNVGICLFWEQRTRLPKRASKKTNICQCLFVPLSHFSFSPLVTNLRRFSWKALYV